MGEQKKSFLRMLFRFENELARIIAISCGFSWSMHHNDHLWREEYWHEAKPADLLHRSSEGPDVSSLESW